MGRWPRVWVRPSDISPTFKSAGVLCVGYRRHVDPALIKDESMGLNDFALLLGLRGDRLISLSPADVLIVVIYFAVVLAIGFYLKRYARTSNDFFMAGREMSAWVAGLSFLSANLGALELMGWAAATYQYGILAAHFYWIAAFPGASSDGPRYDAHLLRLPRRIQCRAICSCVLARLRARWAEFRSPS
jgi:hypothetical protein